MVIGWWSIYSPPGIDYNLIIVTLFMGVPPVWPIYVLLLFDVYFINTLCACVATQAITFA